MVSYLMLRKAVKVSVVNFLNFRPTVTKCKYVIYIYIYIYIPPTHTHTYIYIYRERERRDRRKRKIWFLCLKPYDVAVQYVNHYATETLSKRNVIYNYRSMLNLYHFFHLIKVMSLLYNKSLDKLNSQRLKTKEQQNRLACLPKTTT